MKRTIFHPTSSLCHQHQWQPILALASNLGVPEKHCNKKRYTRSSHQSHQWPQPMKRTPEIVWIHKLWFLSNNQKISLIISKPRPLINRSKLHLFRLFRLISRNPQQSYLRLNPNQLKLVEDSNPISSQTATCSQIWMSTKMNSSKSMSHLKNPILPKNYTNRYKCQSEK